MPVKRPLFIPEKKVYKVKVRWFNVVNPQNMFDMNVIETISIKNKDMQKWRFVDESK
jgi:hypothetical protein